MVATIALVLAEVPSDKIGGAFARTLDQLYSSIRGKGWSHGETQQYVLKFSNDLIEAIKASTLETSGARVQ